MSAIAIEAASLEGLHPCSYQCVPFVRVALNLTLDQRKAAIRELLGTSWSEQDAFEFLRAEFPEWFELRAAPELLAALESILDCCEEDRAARDYCSRQTEIRGIARAAIQKAEGQA